MGRADGVGLLTHDGLLWVWVEDCGVRDGGDVAVEMDAELAVG